MFMTILKAWSLSNAGGGGGSTLRSDWVMRALSSSMKDKLMVVAMEGRL